MMTRHQREDAYAAVGILRNRGWTGCAEAVSQALADLHEYQVSPAPLLPISTWHVPVQPDPEDVKANPDAPSAPEVYTYWVVYAYRSSVSGAQELGACRHERSTPLLSCEDRMNVAMKISADTGRLVVFVSAELTQEGVEL